jgi:hypothetical protein
MAYKKSPTSFVKHKSNAVGFMAEGSAAYMHGPGGTHPDPNKETLVSSKTTKSRETTPEGISGTRVTTKSEFKTPGGKVKRTPEGDKAYAALSQEQRDAQDAKFKAQKRSESQTRFTPDAIKIKAKGLASVKPEITGSMPEKIDTVIGGGDYKFDLSGEKPVYSSYNKVVQSFGGGNTGRYGLDKSDVEGLIAKNRYDKTTKTGAENVLKVSKVQGDVLPGMPKSDKAMYLLGKERAGEAKKLEKAFRSIGAANITDEDKSNYATARQNLLNKYKKLGGDIRRSYLPISQGGGGEHRYTKRIKAISQPIYNSETGLNLFKNK